MGPLGIFLLAGWWLLLAVGVAYWLRRSLAAGEARRRLFSEQSAVQAPRPEELGWLRRWLFVAGYRQPSAPAWFLSATALGMLVGGGMMAGFYASGLYALMIVSVGAVPGGVGEVFLPAVFVAPWLVLLLSALAPWLWVQSVRRKRLEQIEQDLPLTLDLLSTLSEAGIGFDAAMMRLHESRLSGRPLASELRTYQADLLAGRPRVLALRRLSGRVQAPAMSVFVSALVQAEQLGMGIASILRRQADDLRDRRRERALAFAMSLAVKRVVPMVVCFLPGLFVWTLGPFFVQLFQLADALTSTRGLGN